MENRLTARQLAEVLDKHENTIGNWKKAGMPHKMFMGRPYYDLEEVKAWINGETKEE